MFDMCFWTWDELNCVCNHEHKQEYSGSQPSCSLESPEDLLKILTLRSYPRPTVSESWGRGSHRPVVFKALPRPLQPPLPHSIFQCAAQVDTYWSVAFN